MPFVLDCSVALAWTLPDEANAAADALSDRLTHDIALVPSIWPLEVGNVLVTAMRRGRINETVLDQLVIKLRALPVKVDAASTDQTLTETLGLARQHELTTYDAAYLELAKRRDLPLATLDGRLRRAGSATGIDILP